MKWIAIFALTLMPGVAHAQVFSGTVSAVDGDTLKSAEGPIRLLGIDAVEASQTCTRSGAAWPCGKDATTLLAKLVIGRSVTCEQQGTDVYGRILAKCTAGEVDLGRSMVEAGYAVALRNADDGYADSEARMKQLRIGIWNSEFELPATYRLAHPEATTATQHGGARGQAPRLRAAPATNRASTVYFRGCNEAWAAGAAPIYRGQPGYRVEMDGDLDGIACEPHRR